MKLWPLLQHKIPESMMLNLNKSMPKSSVPTEIFQAKVLEQLTGALFSIKKGTSSFPIKIFGEIEVGKEYMFQSKRESEGTVLYVVRQVATNDKHLTAVSVAEPVEKNQTQLTFERVQQLIKDLGLKTPRPEIKEIVKNIENYSGTRKEIAVELTKFLLLRNTHGSTSLPSTLNMLTSSVLSNGSMVDSIREINQTLHSSLPKTPETVKIIEKIESFIPLTPLQSKKEILFLMKSVVKSIGLNFEHLLAQGLQGNDAVSKLSMEQLKPLLPEISKMNINAKDTQTISQLIAKITGFQLLTRDEGSFHHVFLPFPVQLKDEAKDWYIQISSKKKKGDILDPDYCRVVLFIDLPIFSSTMIDLLVQRKIITIGIHHAYPPLESLVEQGLPILKSNLSNKGYTLSAVKTIAKKEDVKEEIFLRFFKEILNGSGEGVDIRV